MFNRLNAEALLWVSLIIKFILALYIPVLGDESYYWFWGQNLQLSYFDHPGMVGWLTWVGSQFTFFPAAIFVRWPFIILSSLSFFIFIKTLRLISKENTLVFWLSFFYLMNPLLGIGGIFATPDIPLVFFWTLSFWLTLKIIETQKSLFYTLLGVSLGLGLCSKYHIVLFPISILISLSLSKQISLIQPKKLLFTIFFGFVFSLPVIIWNYSHDWVSFAFQLNHGFNSRSFSPLWSVTYLLGQTLIFNPFLLIQLLTTDKSNFIKKSAFFQWGFFLMSSFRASVEANWPVTAHIQGLAGINLLNSKFKKWAIIYSISLWFILLGILISDFGQTKFKTLPNSNAATKIWKQISNYSPIYGPTYQMSSLLHLISGTEVLKLNELSRLDFYDSGLFPHPSDKVFYVLKYDTSTWPVWLENTNSKIDQINSFPDYNLSFYRVSRE